MTTSPVTFDDNYPHAAYSLHVRLTDTPEEPIIRVGTIYVLGGTDVIPPIPEDVIDGGDF